MRSDARTPLRPDDRHYVAALSETPLHEVDAVDTSGTPRSMWGEAWHNLVRNPVFLISMLMIITLLIVAAVPSLFTSHSPTYGDLTNANLPPGGDHLLGTTRQGYDVWARVVYGTRTSVTVGFLAMVFSTILGG
ncbi:MAG: ABC transporter permease, partial [Brachybacterium sp.]|nr:ABC transporter permease [Brachybacterium sp.]